MQGSDQVGHSNVGKVGTKWVTLMCANLWPYRTPISFESETNHDSCRMTFPENVSNKLESKVEVDQN